MSPARFELAPLGIKVTVILVLHIGPMLWPIKLRRLHTIRNVMLSMWANFDRSASSPVEPVDDFRAYGGTVSNVFFFASTFLGWVAH